MIEIILRDDLQDYEARPLFGFTYRQVATSAIIIVACAGCGLGLHKLGLSSTVISFAALTVGALIGFVGLGRIQGLKFEQWYAIWSANHAWPHTALFSSPDLCALSQRKPVKACEPTRDEKAERNIESELF